MGASGSLVVTVPALCLVLLAAPAGACHRLGSSRYLQRGTWYRVLYKLTRYPCSRGAWCTGSLCSHSSSSSVSSRYLQQGTCHRVPCSHSQTTQACFSARSCSMYLCVSCTRCPAAHAMCYTVLPRPCYRREPCVTVTLYGIRYLILLLKT